MTRALTCVATLILIGAAPFSTANESSPAAPLLAWNDRVLAVAQAEDGLLTLKGLRTVTMMHLAIHDALANIDHRYASYRYDEQIRSPDRVVAIVQAAYVVAVDQYPDQREMFTALRDRWLPQGSMSTANKDAIELGTATAQAILDLRRGDEWDAEVEYQWHPMGPGVYAEFADHSGTPEGFVFGSGWARARPFALERPDQFRSPPPPSIDSQEYTRAFKEVKQNGRFQSMSRSVDQTHLAMWWKDFAENSHNRLARDLVTKENLDLGVAARLFALLNMSIYDAYVNVFDNKFYYNHWRPYTAIRWAANDGNPDTEAEDSWTNLHRHTYAFPSYPSAHGTACAAAMSVIADTFGDHYSFVMQIREVDVAGPYSGKILMQPPLRFFNNPLEAARECSMSRVWLGIHFRYDSTEGFELGRRIGTYVLGNYLRPK